MYPEEETLGFVGSVLGSLTGGAALANPGVSGMRMSPTAEATELASGRHILSRLFRPRHL
jgi:hypothetical protein